MSVSIPIPSGLTPQQVVDDVAAIALAGVGLLLPEDAAKLVAACIKIAEDAVTLGISPSAATQLQTEVDAEQTAGDAAEEARFGGK